VRQFTGRNPCQLKLRCTNPMYNHSPLPSMVCAVGLFIAKWTYFTNGHYSYGFSTCIFHMQQPCLSAQQRLLCFASLKGASALRFHTALGPQDYKAAKAPEKNDIQCPHRHVPGQLGKTYVFLVSHAQHGPGNLRMCRTIT
jgi:hypothetical protein